jgi:hypothetical protein
MPRTTALDEVIAARGIRPVFMLRDPRDVCVSFMRYVLREPGHAKHALYASLPDDDARLMATIRGRPAGPDAALEPMVASIDTVFRRRLTWLEHPGTLVVRFEALVGPEGGGTAAAQSEALRGLAGHLGLTIDDAALVAIADRVFWSGARTFRRGAIGGWRSELNAEHVAAFKAVAGQLLIELEYETSLDW